jgi:LAS superfamily LD-carboxypeptidase LdcB
MLNMEHKDKKNLLINIIPVEVVLLVLTGVVVYGFVRIHTLTKNVDLLSLELASTTSKLAQNITDLGNQTLGLTNTLSNTQQNIDAVKSQVGGVEQTVGSISGTVGTLQKLAEIDPEVLKKYSKVYFMNENYAPKYLFNIPSEYLYSTTRPEQYMVEAWPFLKNLLDNAKASGVTIFIKSAYRSFAEQQSIKSAYSVVYGAGTANTFSADQGYSEHQIGTTLDFVSTGTNGQLSGFDNTEAYKWLTNNAYRYGFVLSYPKGNNYYIYEPWHWRFVGVKLATYLHNAKLNFYDMDQREIDKYLVGTFDF